MKSTWDYWQRHINYVVEQYGQWVGVCDENYEPLYDLPPLTEFSAPVQALEPAALTIEISLPESQLVESEIYHDLFAGAFAHVNADGGFSVEALPPRTVVVQRPDVRLAYTVVVPQASGGVKPEKIQLDLVELKELAKAWPAPSAVTTWESGLFQIRTEDAATAYSAPRDMALVELATKVDGYTYGKKSSELILRELYQDSIDTVCRLCGWSAHMVVDWASSGVDSPLGVLTTTDNFLWETGLELAKTAGVDIHARLWWPFDEPVKTRNGVRRWDTPMIVWEIKQRRKG